MKRLSTIGGYDMLVIQMLYTGAAAGFIYPCFIIRSTEGAYWIPLVIWAIGALLSSWMYSRLLARLNGEKLLARIIASIGVVWTCIICLPVFLFLFAALVTMLRAYSEMITMTMLPTTPIAFLNGMLLAPAVLALAGMMPIVRAARVFFLFTVLLTLGLLIVGLSDVHWTLGAPWIRTNGDFFYDKSFYAGSFMWMGFVITSFIGPYTGQSARRAWKAYATAILCGLPFIAGHIYLPIVTFGRELSKRLTFPFISKMDAISHYWVLVENLTAIFVSVTMFYILVIMALKLRAVGEMFSGLIPRANIRIIYALAFLAVYTAATLLTSWRTVEEITLLTIGFRLYVMFIFPLLGWLALAYGQRVGKEESL
ncbi:GerAB/ArcD/ProY family transporter [Paenibacillus glycanilyticus]|uniref:GerAB/ArcD/ProY family transporter n=1 Tax=Paenibacillus glycanilyticus TaxID=126569 RepID=UPI00204247EA|nr:GerAB/ArcD/ProY family transporter [Paenibacillus glycanilyticus]MCM3630837.1 GerAB/ArcD/ProY family transporter [Paenibacillus glycanilyticus]